MDDDTGEACFILRKVDIGDAQLTSSSIAEPDTGEPAVWNAATSYNTGDQVTRTTTHRKYQRLAGGSSVDASLPENAPALWDDIGATNRWAAFDNAVESQSTQAEEITIVLTPGTYADAIALINLEGSEVRCQVAGTDYDQTIRLATRSVGGWRDYFFQPFDYRSAVVFTNLPLRFANVVTLTVRNPGATAKVGVIVAGRTQVIGWTQHGADAGFLDFSVKTKNDRGETTLEEGSYADTMNLQVYVDPWRGDTIDRLLRRLRAQFIVIAGAGNQYASLLGYGFLREPRRVFQSAAWHVINIEFEGAA